MEYTQFSNIKGIFKNFFHKKEDFNNKELISKKEGEVWGLKIGLNVGLLCFYVIIASLFGVLPKFKDVPHALKLFVLMVVIALGQYGYYYYANGEKEITDFIYKKKTPYVAFTLLFILIVIAGIVYLSQQRGAMADGVKTTAMAGLKTFIHKYWHLIAAFLFIMGFVIVAADNWLGFTGLDFMYTIIITGIIWIIILMTLLFIRYGSKDPAANVRIQQPLNPIDTQGARPQPPLKRTPGERDIKF